MNLRDLSKKLRTMADDMDAGQAALTHPVEEGVSIAGAFLRLRGLIDDDMISVEAKFEQYSNSRTIEVSWQIYDGSSRGKPGPYFLGKTLADAVNACLQSHQSQKDGNAEADMQKIEQELMPY